MGSLFPTPKTPKPVFDNTIIEPAKRGTICPVSLGINRVSPVVGFVGGTRWVVASSGGGKGSGGSEQKQIYYSMSGIHFLSVGEGAALTRIYQNGKPIFEGRLTPDNFASGSSFTILGEGTFRIYWGGNNPAVTDTYNTVDSSLASLTGVSTRYPYIFYIIWDQKALGTSKRWPNLEYEIQVNPQTTTLFGEDVVLESEDTNYTIECDFSLYARKILHFYDDTFYEYSIIITTTDSNAAYIKSGWGVTGIISGVTINTTVVSISEAGGTYTLVFQNPVPTALQGLSGDLVFSKGVNDGDDAGISRGLNPVSIIYQLLFETYPHGLGQDTSKYDLTDLESIFDFYAATETFLPMSLYLKDGQSFEDGLSSVFQDAGILMGWDSNTGKYRFTRPVSTDTPTAIPDDDFNLKKAEIETDYAQLDPELRTYSFKDKDRRFTDSTILIPDDGKSKEADFPNAKKIEMSTVRDINTASFVAAYREREEYGKSNLLIQMPKDKITLIPGHLYSFEGLSGKYRLIEKGVVPDNVSIDCEFREDAYSEVTQYVVKESSGVFPIDSLAASLDTQTVIVETNRFITPNQDGIFFLRVRANPQIEGTFPYLSNNDVTYNQLAPISTYVVGGELTEALAEDGASIIITGPEFTVNGPDIGNVLDLSSDDDKIAWKNGEQLCLIGNELFYLRGITPTTTEAGYTLDGLVRARMGTVRGSHNIGDSIYIFPANMLSLIQDALIISGSTLYMKSQPYTNSNIMDLSEVDAVSLNYNGGGYKPLDPVNLSTEDRTKGFVSGTDVELVWGYKNVLGGAGAGLGLSDEPYNAPLPEGYFRLEFRTTGNTLIRTVDNLTDASYTYPDATRISDFSGNSFKVRVYNILNGLLSDYDEITVTPAGV